MVWLRGRFYLDMGGWHLEESRAEGKEKQIGHDVGYLEGREKRQRQRTEKTQ